MIEDPVTNVMNVGDLHPLAIVAVEGEDTVMIENLIVAVEIEDTVMRENLIVGIMNARGLRPLTTQTREVVMSKASEAQEHLQDPIGTVGDGNGKIHLVGSTVMNALAPKGNQCNLLC